MRSIFILIIILLTRPHRSCHLVSVASTFRSFTLCVLWMYVCVGACVHFLKSCCALPSQHYSCINQTFDPNCLLFDCLLLVIRCSSCHFDVVVCYHASYHYCPRMYFGQFLWSPMAAFLCVDVLEAAKFTPCSCVTSLVFFLLVHCVWAFGMTEWAAEWLMMIYTVITWALPTDMLYMAFVLCFNFSCLAATFI